MRLGIATESQPPVIRKKAIWVGFRYPGSVSGSFDRELTGDPGQGYLVEYLLNFDNLYGMPPKAAMKLRFLLAAC